MKGSAQSAKAALSAALAEILGRWRTAGDWTRIECQELIHVRGLPNKEVARLLGLSEDAPYFAWI